MDIGMKTKEKKERVIAEFLGCEIEDLTEKNYNCYGLPIYSDYAIGTDEEADEAAREYIQDSLWAFNASFIIGECNLDYSLEDMITNWQQEKCESANDGIRSLIDNSCGIDEFVNSAISADGRGHFLATYDGNEIEQDGFYIYRIG